MVNMIDHLSQDDIVQERDVRAALDRLIQERGEDYASVSRLLGRNAAYIQQFIKRGTPRRLAEDDRAKLAAYFAVPETLLGGRGNQPELRKAGSGSAKRTVVMVPILSVGASAGPGAAVEGEAVDAGFGFDPRWLRKLGADPRALSIIRVEGDSMAPTLGDGDDILVDSSDAASRLRDGIYVLRMDDMLMVKRIARAPGRGVVDVVSDNSQYPTHRAVSLDMVALVGRVVWAGRKVR